MPLVRFCRSLRLALAVRRICELVSVVLKNLNNLENYIFEANLGFKIWANRNLEIFSEKLVLGGSPSKTKLFPVCNRVLLIVKPRFTWEETRFELES